VSLASFSFFEVASFLGFKLDKLPLAFGVAFPLGVKQVYSCLRLLFDTSLLLLLKAR
jgi:hypothetical protein